MGATSAGAGPKLRIFNLKQKCSESEIPHFIEKVKQGESWVEAGEQHTSFFGRIVNAELYKGKDAKGVEFSTFRFTFDDGDERSVVQMMHGKLCYNLLNTLASEFDPTKVLRIYANKKSEKVNDMTYWNPVCFVNIDPFGREDSLKWAFGGEDLKKFPKPEQVFVNGQPFKQNGKNVFDHSKVEQHWEEIAKNHVFPKFSEGPVTYQNDLRKAVQAPAAPAEKKEKQKEDVEIPDVPLNAKQIQDDNKEFRQNIDRMNGNDLPFGGGEGEFNDLGF
jgi:hypothetical protein